MGKRACKIHQRGMEQVSSSICSYLFFIALGNVLDRDNFVRSWSATWRDCCFWHPAHHTGPMKCKEQASKRQLPVTARQSAAPSSLLQAHSGTQSSTKIHHLQFLTAKLSQWKGNRALCDTPHLAKMIHEGLSGGSRSALTYFGRPCPVLINFFIQKQYFLFPPPPPGSFLFSPPGDAVEQSFFFTATCSSNQEWIQQAMLPREPPLPAPRMDHDMLQVSLPRKLSNLVYSGTSNVSE